MSRLSGDGNVVNGEKNWRVIIGALRKSNFDFFKFVKSLWISVNHAIIYKISNLYADYKILKLHLGNFVFNFQICNK